VRPSDASGGVTCGVLDGHIKSRDMRCAEMLAHAEALMERRRVVMREVRGRYNVFVNGHGQG